MGQVASHAAGAPVAISPLFAAQFILQAAGSHLPSLHFVISQFASLHLAGSQVAVPEEALVSVMVVHVAADGHFAQFADTSEAAFLTSGVPFCALTNKTTTKASTTKPDKPIITFFIFMIYINFT
jgi:hypothetical protein